MENVWVLACPWVGLAFIATLPAFCLHLCAAQHISFAVGAGAIILTFLAATELDETILRTKWEVSQAIQYAFFVYENRFVEIDFKRNEERQANFRGFARAQEIFEFLVNHGQLQFPVSAASR